MAFTLIELLVVISMIALLISILLPALDATRRQAKKVVCQSNMKNVNTALLTYVNEFDTYPVLFKSQPLSWATWSFGGWTGKDFETYCNPNATGTFCFQTHQRPLSVYMLQPHEVRPDQPGADGIFGTADDLVTPMPVFRCPSDTVATQWRWRYGSNWECGDTSQNILELSSYEQCGSSYQMNFYWFYQAQERARRRLPVDYTYPELWAEAFEIGTWLWRWNEEHGGASRFVTLVEDPFDWGIAQDIRASADADADEDHQHSVCGEQTMGFHGKWSRHMVAFLDGHVEYLRADTRYQRERNWTVTHERWHDTRRASNCP
jgi:prepilin-type processing-associated H-X9-DG protein